MLRIVGTRRAGSAGSRSLCTHLRLLRPRRIRRTCAVPHAGQPLGHASIRPFSTSIPVKAIVPFKLHDIGEGITEVEMLAWKVKVGQRVEHFDDLCEVQSDKSMAELTAPVGGIIHSISPEEGETVKVGETLCEIKTDEEDEEATDQQEEVEDKGAEALNEVREVIGAEAVSERQEKEAETPTASTSIPPDPPQGQNFDPSEEADVASLKAQDDPDHSTAVRFSGEASILPSAPPVSAPSSSPPPQSIPRRANDGIERDKKVFLSSPAVRALAGKVGVDLGQVKGTGAGGRVTREDVEMAACGACPSASRPDGNVSKRSTRGVRETQAEVTRVEFGRTRKVMWKALGPQGSVPHFGYSHTLDLTPLLPYLKAANPSLPDTPRQSYLASDIPPSLARAATPEGLGTKTTLLSFLVKTMLLAMEEHPIMRSKAVEEGNDRWLNIRRDSVIGIAVSDPKHGLVTPSLPPLPSDVPLHSITEHLSALRQKSTQPGTSANLVISSIGSLGEGIGAMPILPPGGPLAICAVGRAKWETEWKLKDVGLRGSREDVEAGGMRAVLRCPVGWSGDHRVLEGAELIAFTESWKRWMQEPWRLIKMDG